MAATQGGRCEFSLGDPKSCQVTLTLPRGRPASVLVVEDNADTVALYRRFLAGREWQLQIVSDPSQALEAAVRGQPRAIILDIMMPGMDGWSLLQALRAEPVTAGIPVLVCSVVDDPQLAAALGATAYVKKPISQEQLLSSLRRLLG
jgi:CheY-like chemotaxis protein